MTVRKGLHNMLSNDLRDWLKERKKNHRLKLIEGADWNIELSTVAQLNTGKEPPALLFKRIKDYPPGYGVVCGALRTQSNIESVLGLPSHKSRLDLLKTLQTKFPEWEAKAAGYPPRFVKSGPVLEEVHSAKDVDVLEFPAPKWHDFDGGRYIGTGDIIVTRNPYTDEVNFGTYRVMVHDATTLGIMIVPGHHGFINMARYHEQGKACPVAISLGHHPLLFAASALDIPGSEYNFAGAVRGKPFNVIKEEITGLPIPADSEIVLAGWFPVGARRKEGPFGEWTGYYASGETSSPVMEIKRIYHRKDPSILGCSMYRPPDDFSPFSTLARSAMLFNELKKNDVPDVQGCWLSESGVHTFITISIKQRYPGHAKQAGIVASHSAVTANMGRYIVVVDEDIDPTNINEVIWAMGFRSDPKNSIDIIRNAWSNPLDPMIRKPSKALVNSRAIIDACRPFDWIDTFPKVVEINPEVARRVREKWALE